jgi:hypothetical protein
VLGVIVVDGLQERVAPGGSSERFSVTDCGMPEVVVTANEKVEESLCDID